MRLIALALPVLAGLLCTSAQGGLDLGLLPLECIENQPEILGLSHGETVFDISACPDLDTVKEDVRRHLVNDSGYRFEWFHTEKTTLADAITFLETDHRNNYGSPPFCTDEVAQVSAFAESDKASSQILYGQFSDSYLGGTSVTGLIFLFTAENDRLILLTKPMYEE